MFEKEKIEKLTLKKNNSINLRSKEYYDLINNFRQYDFCLKSCTNNQIENSLSRKDKFCLKNCFQKVSTIKEYIWMQYEKDVDSLCDI